VEGGSERCFEWNWYSFSGKAHTGVVEVSRQPAERVVRVQPHLARSLLG